MSVVMIYFRELNKIHIVAMQEMPKGAIYLGNNGFERD